MSTSSLPVAVITGTNSGLGLALTVLLSQTHKVYAGMRSLSKRDDLDVALEAKGQPSNVVVIAMDVNSDESVTTAFASILEQEQSLDVLICNAGYSVFGTVELLTMENIKAQFETNVFGVIRCQQAVLPKLREQKSGKIIVISSVGGVWGQPFNDVYCASKFAIEGLLESQAALFRTMGIRVTSVQPGGIRSKFMANAQLPDFKSMPAGYGAPMQNVMGYYRASTSSQTPEEVAQSIYDGAVAVDGPTKLQVNSAIQQVFTSQLSDPTGESGALLGMAMVNGSTDRAL